MAGKSATPADVRLGARIRAARIAAARTQRDVAAALGISAAQLQKYEKGTNRIAATDLHLVAAVVQLPIAAFFDRPGPPSDARGLGAGEAREALCEAAEAYFAAKQREGALAGGVMAFIAEPA